MAFPKGFVWGAASASYQVEGAAYDDGKGLSVWDMFCKRPKAIKEGHTGDIACDHYHRYGEDVSLMGEIGLKAYRFSISWPRVLPEGTGKVNQKGLDFYDRLVDNLLEKGIEPYATLFHWDYPYTLHKKGGWLNPDSPAWFAEYTGAVVERLSDRVRNWFTLNEPATFIAMGHEAGVHAPGLKLDSYDSLMAIHHVLLAHGKSVQAIRGAARREPCVGIVIGAPIKLPAATGSREDTDAARESMFAITYANTWANAWWMDPIFFGRYPEVDMEIMGKYAPEVKPGDMEIISQPLDFLALNIYHASTVGRDETGAYADVPRKWGYPRTGNRWSVTPEAAYWGPKYIYERYGKPLIIAENGMAGIDWVSLDGKVHDMQRIDFTHRYLQELERAIGDGVDVRGYFHWSITDNFEWAEGYTDRFGLIHVDFESQKRIIKDSGYWYRKVIESNGAIL